MGNDPIKVYLDQNALTALAKSAKWQETDLGKVLCDPSVESWISPVNFVEIVQASDPSMRIALARTALELADFKRVLPTYQRGLVNTFVALLRNVDPELVHDEYLTHHAEDESRGVIAALSVLALGRTPEEAAVLEVLNSKFGSQLLHAKAVADPKGWVNGIVKAADELQLTEERTDHVLDRQSIAELRDAAAEEEPEGGIGKKVRALLQKNRRKISRAYGAVELGESLVLCLPLPLDIRWTFDAAKLHERWNDIFDAIRAPRAPFQEDVYTSLLAISRGLAKGRGLLPGTISNEVVLREVERFASHGARPNAGVAFDGDHAAYLLGARVFVCDDNDLRESAQAILPLIREETGGRWDPIIVGVSEAGDAIRALLRD